MKLPKSHHFDPLAPRTTRQKRHDATARYYGLTHGMCTHRFRNPKNPQQCDDCETLLNKCGTHGKTHNAPQT
jgi:hypothetical protein